MSTTRKILIIDDDDALREMLVEQFDLHQEFQARCAVTGAAGIKKVRSGTFDLIILGVGLPDMGGYELCELMRKGGLATPIIMLAAEQSDTGVILGLNAGADDYVIKPFHFRVLLARIRAQLREHDRSENAFFTIGPYTFWTSAKTLTGENHRTIKLTEKEAAILKALHRAERQVVSRDTLLREVWGYHRAVTTHTLETHVYRLRQAMEPDPSRPDMLITESGGYKLLP